MCSAPCHSHVNFIKWLYPQPRVVGVLCRLHREGTYAKTIYIYICYIMLHYITMTIKWFLKNTVFSVNTKNLPATSPVLWACALDWSARGGRNCTLDPSCRSRRKHKRTVPCIRKDVHSCHGKFLQANPQMLSKWICVDQSVPLLVFKWSIMSMMSYVNRLITHDLYIFIHL